MASRYPTRLLRSYVRVKVATDPVYDAVFQLLRHSSEPVLDIGCGVGVLAFYLRERGFKEPIMGVDHDPRKIDIARRVAEREEKLSFTLSDARSPIPFRGTVVLLDVLHYFSDADQSSILRNAAAAGGTVVIRDALRDGSFRYRVTYVQEALARLGGWLRAERLRFPTRETIESSLNGDFEEDIKPMFGRMPFNNYLFVFSRSSDGMMKT